MFGNSRSVLIKVNMDVFVVLLMLSGFCVSTASFPNIYYFISENKTWDEANAYCIMEYTGLAQITNPENNTALMNTSAGGYTGKAWIGLVGPLGWVWLDGTQATYFMWDQEPWASDTGYCGLTTYHGWHSVICEYEWYFICFNGSDYIVNKTRVTWNDAKISCENKNSTLAQILDLLTFDKVRRAFRNNNLDEYEPLWIGLSFSPVWFWSETKQISTFVNWKTGQPNNKNNCAAVLVGNGTWTTEPCSEQHPFFCYGVHKSKKTVLSMNIQTDVDLETPDNQAALMEQLQAALAKQGVTDFKLTWTKQPVQKSRKKTDDACLNV
uniref:C-type lectin domain-containing protein n=1 Tax=Astatotilapia calliptera TaxID=8154 RepID=A0AAX7UV31_ASTCA